MKPPRRGFRKFLGDNGMSVALFGLFGVCLAGQSLSGWLAYSEALRAAGLPGLGYGAYLLTGNFLDGVFSNWQAAVLQLAVLVAFGSVLRQKGAAHSRKEDVPGHRTLEWKFGARETPGEWLAANSLSVVLTLLFAATFALHTVFGHRAYNEEQALRHLPAVPLGDYAGSSSFWSSVFQCWEAEFAAIGLYLVFSIFLRQEHSPESKPVGASDDQTGGANE